MTKNLSKVTAAITALAFSASIVFADEHPEVPELVINGEMTLAVQAPAPSYLENLETIYSGWVFRTKETRELEMDDFDNPSFVFVDSAIDRFAKVEGTAGKSCANCHADVEDFAGLTATLPRVNSDGKLENLVNLINECRVDRMGAEPWKGTGTAMAEMSALIGLQSRGMPVNVAVDGAAAPFWEKGKELYYTRVGQLNMSCANCHEDNYNVMIRADHLSQGQSNGFPTYRLKNAKMNTIQARFKGCMKNIRAQPYKPGGPEFNALELYVASRGNGLMVETPSVRN